MPVNVSRTSALTGDADSDGVVDAGDALTTHVVVHNATASTLTNLNVFDTQNGITIDPASVKITPIAFDDDLPSIVGNTPITFTAAQLLGNDIDPDGPEASLTITGVSNAAHGTIVNNGDGTFTFTPATGYAGAASFQYTITDAQGLASVSTGVVNFNVTDPVWYVNAATGSDVTGDGSYARPFASLVPLNTGGSADALDNADDTIFVYNAGTYANASIVLEAGQKLFGDGHAFTVNGLTIGANASNTTLSHSGTAITLSTNNSIDGLDLVGTAVGAIGIADGGTAVGTLTVSNVAVSGQGQIIDVDQGGTLAVTLNSASSTGSAGSADGSGAIDLNTMTGVFTVSGATSITGGSHTGGGIDITNSSSLTVNLQGNVTVNTGGNIAINFSGNAGASQFNMSGSSKDIDTSTGIALNFTNNGSTGGGTVSITGGGLDVATTTGKGIIFTGGGTLNITGAGNSVSTAQGGILDFQNVTMGTGGIQFATLSASGSVLGSAGNAININNLDAAGAGTFNGGAVTIVGTAGAGADGINISGGSNSTFTFASATIGGGAAGTSPIGGDGIELNGANGAVTFTTVNVNGSAGNGINIVGATNAVNVNGGSIGSTNDAAGDGVNISGGTVAGSTVSIAAAITKTSAGDAVDISGRGATSGTVTISGALNASGGAQDVNVHGNAGGTVTFSGNITGSSSTAATPISISNNTGGTTDFTGQTIALTGTGSANGVDLSTNTGATINFNSAAGGNGLDIVTATGTGFNAVGGGTITVSGSAASGNSITTVGGVALNVNNTNIGAAHLTFHDINANGGAKGITLNTTGSSGGLHVTGTGTTDNSGGTIQNTDARGIELIGTSNVQLANMRLLNANDTTNGSSLDLDISGSNAALWMSGVNTVALNNIDISGTTVDNGITGINVSNFVMDNSTIDGAGNAANESGIEFSNLGGTSSITNSTISFSKTNSLDIVNTNTNLTLTVNNVVFRDTQTNSAAQGGGVSSLGEGGLQFRNFGNGVANISVLDSDFWNLRTQAIQIVGQGSSTTNVDITNNNIDSLHGFAGVPVAGGQYIGAGVDINANDTSHVNFNVNGNPLIRTNQADAVNITSFASGQAMGRVDNNVINVALIGAGVRVVAQETSHTTIEVKGNTITEDAASNNNSSAITGQARFQSARLDMTIDGNTTTVNESALNDIDIIAGSSTSGETNQVYVDFKNNHVSGVAGANNIIFRLRVSDLDGTSDPRIFLHNFVEGGSGIEDDAIATWNAHSNTPTANTVNVNVSLTGTATGIQAGTVQVVTNPLPSFALGQIAPGPNGGSATSDDSGLGSAPTERAVYDPTMVGIVAPADPLNQGTPWLPTGSIIDPTGNGGAGASAPATAPITAVDDGILTQARLDDLVAAAIERWAAAGASDAQIATMQAVKVGITDMMGVQIGGASPGTIEIDDNAGGYGWFIDTSAGDDREFAGSGTKLVATTGGGAAGHIDLLTVLMHELGHQIGLDDAYRADRAGDVMYGYANVGERRLPGAGEAGQATGQAPSHEAFVLSPVAAVGDLPAGKDVDIQFTATVNTPTGAGLVANLSNTSTASYNGGTTTASAAEVTVIDSLSLGDHVFLDVNNNGIFDAGDTNLAGVSLTLFADTNANGVYDNGVDQAISFIDANSNGVFDASVDTPAAAGAPGAITLTTTTDANGLYSFGHLAPGDYIVRVNSTNFTGGGVLVGRQAVAATSDPDNNVNDDSNVTQFLAGQAGTYAASQAVTLAFNTEPTAGTGNDTNNTLDFGFSSANHAPVANADTLTATNEDTPLTYAASSLTTNDSDPDGDAFSITSVTNGAHGTAVLNGNGTVTYTPNADYNGPDTWSYTITDSHGATASANASVTVNPVNDAPTGTDATFSAHHGTPHVLTVADFGFGDIEGNAFVSVTIASTPTAGRLLYIVSGSPATTVTVGQIITVADITAGKLVYKPTPGVNDAATGSFTFQVHDDGGIANGGVDTDQSPNTLTFTVPPNTAPAGQDATIAVTHGTPHVLTLADFGFSDVDGDAFSAITVDTPPSVGRLLYIAPGQPAVAITANQVISATDIADGRLVYKPTPTSGGAPIGSFTFQVHDDGGTANGGVDIDQSPNTLTFDASSSSSFAAFAVKDHDATAFVLPSQNYEPVSGGSGFGSALFATDGSSDGLYLARWSADEMGHVLQSQQAFASQIGWTPVLDPTGALLNEQATFLTDGALSYAPLGNLGLAVDSVVAEAAFRDFIPELYEVPEVLVAVGGHLGPLHF